MKKKTNEIKKRVLTLLTSEELTFIDKLKIEAFISTQCKLSRIDIIAAFIDAAMAKNISGKDVKNKDQLVQKILESTKAEDRRQYPRFKKSLNVLMRSVESLSKQMTSITKDISKGGFSVEIEKPDDDLVVGKTLEFFLNDQGSIHPPIQAFGRIKWITPKENGQGFLAGVQVTYIKAKDLPRFLSYLEDEKC